MRAQCGTVNRVKPSTAFEAASVPCRMTLQHQLATSPVLQVTTSFSE